jgi:hypothetical protein
MLKTPKTTPGVISGIGRDFALRAFCAASSPVPSSHATIRTGAFHPDPESPMTTTRYFEEQVLRKRPYLQREWCERVIANPLKRDPQADGRIRFWGIVPELGNRVLRVVTLEDGTTVHNAFPDRDFPVAGDEPDLP